MKAVCDWLKLQTMRDIQVFLGFTNFYWQFIQGFSKLATLFTSILKTTSVVGPAASVKVGDEEQDSKRI